MTDLNKLAKLIRDCKKYEQEEDIGSINYWMQEVMIENIDKYGIEYITKIDDDSLDDYRKIYKYFFIDGVKFYHIEYVEKEKGKRYVQYD